MSQQPISSAASSSTPSLSAVRVGKQRGPAVVLDDVSVTLVAGRRVGIVGPNGVGKTTLLRILAGLEPPDAGTVERVPGWATVGYLPQELDHVPGETLLGFLGRRTGVTAAGEALELSAAGLAERPSVFPAGGEATPPADPAEAYSLALDRYMALGGPDLDSRAAEVCGEVGLGEELLDVPLAGLSGGQRARASLAAVLLSRFDYLLLDEPTNDLDFGGLDRLEAFISGVRSGVAIVSHDRAFLERTITSVLEIDENSHAGTEFRGGWLAYLEQRDTARRHASEAYEGYVAERQRLLARVREQRQWAVVGVAKAKGSPQDNDKAQRDFRVNRTEKQAAKVRTSERAIARLDGERLEKPWEGWELRMELPATAKASEVAAWLSQAVLERGEFRLGPIDLEIRWRERVGLVGPNGCGKTSLIEAMLGRLPLASGARGLGPSTVVGELDQARARLGVEAPLLDVVAGATGATTAATRSLLAKFGLLGEHVLRPARTLSPGERTRAELALLAAGETNLLVLDEPTNHLDLPAIEQLEQALESYDGTLLLVTHDRRLLEAIELTRTVSLGPR